MRRRITIEFDETVAKALAARIDDNQPTLEKVAAHVLTQTGQGWSMKAGDNFSRGCTCGLLQEWANAPDGPIKFDSAVNEYAIVKKTEHGESSYVVRYCFSCGGRAPKSKRD